MQQTDASVCVCVCIVGFVGEEGEIHLSFSHTLSLQISPDPAEANWAWPKMLHVIFEVNKVHINDKTSQSSERGG